MNEISKQLIEEISTIVVKTIATKVLKNLRNKMPTTNTWEWDYAFEDICYDFGIDMKEICNE